MKRKGLAFSTVLILLLGVMLGFTNQNDNPKKGSTSTADRKGSSKRTTESVKNINVRETDNNGGGYQVYGSPYYTDNFDGLNDTTSLKARGYKVYYRGTGPQGVLATWIQGVPTNFVSYNGPTDGYVAGHYNSVTGTNNIDNWLVLPKKTTSAGDSLVFYSRSPTGSTFPDSLRVMYSAVGDSIPEGSWTELGRFKGETSGSWLRKAFRAPTSGNTRFAIRYAVVNGGPSGANSDFVGIDALTIEAPSGANDIATSSIIAPGNTVLPTPTIAPKAVFSNAGTANQTNIPVTFKITGPVNYTNNKTIASLSAGASTQVTFDSTFLPAAGTYNITVYCSLATDGNRLNDTLKSTITVLNPNYGGGGAGTGGYFFANSTTGSNGAPSKPKYCRIDTTGSISLVVNNVASVPLTAGTLDDGQWALAGVGGLRKVKFFGVTYDSIFIGTNGLICFTNFLPGGGNWSPPSAGLPSAGPGGGCRPGIYPGWNDLDWGNTSQPINRLSYKIDNTKNLLLITYDRAPLYAGTSTDFQTYQVVMELQKDTVGAPNSNMLFGIDSSYTTVNVPFLVGIQDPTGANYIQYTFIDATPTVITPGPLFDGTAGVAIEFGPNASNLTGFCKTLNLKALIEGFWNSPTNIGDTLTVQLRSSVSPYNVIDVARGKNDASGNLSVILGAQNNRAYYIVVKHRNGLETWSVSGATTTWTSNTLSYDFTTSAAKAFGGNLTLKGGKYTIYSGDVNQDGTIDITDQGLIDNDAFNFVGGYVPTDVNGDGFVDVSDASITENNAFNFISLIRP